MSNQKSDQEKVLAYVNKNWQESAGNGFLPDMEKWLSKGADINFKDEYGQTALMVASRKDNLDVVSFLIDHHACVHAKDDRGNTALHAAYGWGEYPKIAKLLLDAGANLEEKNDDLETPFSAAVEFAIGYQQEESSMLLLLFERGADVSVKIIDGRTCAGAILDNPDIFRNLTAHLQAKLDKDAISSSLPANKSLASRSSKL